VEEAWELAALMPTVLRWKGFIFLFYAKEEDRPHIHIYKQGAQAKVWLDTLEFHSHRNFSQKDLNVIQKKVEAEKALMLEAWNDFFGK